MIYPQSANTCTIFRVKVLCALIALSFSSLACGREIIKRQSNANNSAVTLYINVEGYSLKGITLKNLKHGSLYRAERAGWELDFFPVVRRYAAMAVGDLPPGRYTIHSIALIRSGSGDRHGKQTLLTLLDTGPAFTLSTKKIKYLGEYRCILLPGKKTHGPSLITALKKYQKKTVYRIPVKVQPGGLTTLLECRQRWSRPSPMNRDRTGEINFLLYLMVKGREYPIWAQLAGKHLLELYHQAIAGYRQE